MQIPAFASDAIQAGKEKAMICSACHGKQGISDNPLFPNIAGQHASYLAKQLHDYKEGKTRTAASMRAMVQNLSDQDIDELAAFYASLPKAAGTTPIKYLSRGEQLYRGGDSTQHISACIACHGPQGTGNAQAKFPVLSGQHADYLTQQLKAYQDKTRSNDLNAIMRDITARMSDEDINAISHYCTGLH